ncbi:hypothetical protein VaNZ11_002213, partial [Volvox africanus]
MPASPQCLPLLELIIPLDMQSSTPRPFMASMQLPGSSSPPSSSPSPPFRSPLPQPSFPHGLLAWALQPLLLLLPPIPSASFLHRSVASLPRPITVIGPRLPQLCTSSLHHSHHHRCPFTAFPSLSFYLATSLLPRP